MKIVLQTLVASWQRNRAWLAAFFALWLVALCIPPVRQLLLFDMFGSSITRSKAILFSTFWSDEYEIGEFDFKAVAQQDSATEFALVQQEENRAAYKQAMQEYDSFVSVPPPGQHAPPPKENPENTADRLIEKYPNEAWLYAWRLRKTLSWLSDNRLAGVYEMPWQANNKIPKKIPEKSNEKPSFTDAQWNQALISAKRAQQLEPQNAFFDTVLIYLYLAKNRDDEAIRVLTSAVKKTTFDDHLFDEILASIRAHERIRPLLLEEKITLSNHGVTGPFTRISLLMAWIAWKQEQRGEKLQGLQLRYQVAQLGALMNRSRNFSSWRNIAAQTQGNAWKRAPWGSGSGKRILNLQRHFRPNSAEWKLCQTTPSAIDFMLAARQWGQASIASETLQQAHEYARFEKIANSMHQFGYTQREWLYNEAWDGLRYIFYVQISLLVAATLGMGFFLLGSHPGECSNKSLKTSTLLSATSVGLSLMIFMSLARWHPQSLESLWTLAFFAIAVLSPVIISALHAWAYAMWKLRQLRKTGQAVVMEKRDVLAVGASWCFGAVALAAAACALIASYFGIASIKVWTVSLNILPPITPFSVSDPAVPFTFYALFLSAALYVCWFFAWRAFTPKPLQPLLHGALRLHRRALSTFILCSGALYILFVITALPYRATQEARWQRYLQHGEMVVRQQ